MGSSPENQASRHENLNFINNCNPSISMTLEEIYSSSCTYEEINPMTALSPPHRSSDGQMDHSADHSGNDSGNPDPMRNKAENELDTSFSTKSQEIQQEIEKLKLGIPKSTSDSTNVSLADNNNQDSKDNLNNLHLPPSDSHLSLLSQKVNFQTLIALRKKQLRNIQKSNEKSYESPRVRLLSELDESTYDDLLYAKTNSIFRNKLIKRIPGSNYHSDHGVAGNPTS